MALVREMLTLVINTYTKKEYGASVLGDPSSRGASKTVFFAHLGWGYVNRDLVCCLVMKDGS
jgi:hypothetical protein